MPTKCSYPSCVGISPDTLLEICGNRNFNNRFHHHCQVEYESKHADDNGLNKYCINCCDEAIGEKHGYDVLDNQEEDN